jgi:hypothetical protein
VVAAAEWGLPRRFWMNPNARVIGNINFIIPPAISELLFKMKHLT